MTDFSRDLHKYRTFRNELREFKQRLKGMYEVKTFVFQGMVVVPEEEIERLKANAVRNHDLAYDLEKRIQKLTEKSNLLVQKIENCLPLYNQWVKVANPSGFFLVQKTRIEKGTTGKTSILIIDEYNEKEERINR